MFAGSAPWERLLTFAAAIYQEVPGINRCIQWLGDTLPTQARPLFATVKRERLELLREADAIVMDCLRRYGAYQQIWQCPTVLVPLEIDGRGRELVILRPIHSERAMTATPAPLPADLLAELCPSVLALPGVSGIALDVTTKPPGTIEWE
jgi:GMP synthase (glutamine-hydrolysing)